MTFVSYTPLDAIGTAAGLSLLEKVANNFWQGSFLGESILTIFVFLSLAKIAIDGIVEHKYETAIVEFSRLAIVILLFTVKTTATIFDMNVINFGYARKAAEIGSTISSNIHTWYPINNTNPTSAQMQEPGVPLMAYIYAIPDNLAYQISDIMMNPKKTMTIDLASIVLDPKQILAYGLDSMIRSSTDGAYIEQDFALCYDTHAYEIFSKHIKAPGVKNYYIVIPARFGMPLTIPAGNNKQVVCQKFNQAWAEYVQNIENQMEQEGNVNPSVFKSVNSMVYLLKNGYMQQSEYKEKYLGPEIKALEQDADNLQKIPGTQSSTAILSPSPGQNGLMNNAIGISGGFLSYGAGTFSQFLFPRLFFEDLMMHMQEYAIAIMFLLLPFVVILGLLPIFGSNYKLIIKYAISFFLIKLWVPIIWFIYISMVDVSALFSSAVNINHEINNGIEYAIATFTGQPAFAQIQQTQQQTQQQNQQTQQQNQQQGISPVGGPPNGYQDFQKAVIASQTAYIADQRSKLNTLILEAMYTIVPVVLGSSATYLVGKGMVDTGVAAAAEGMMVARWLWGNVVKRAPGLLKNLRGGGVPPNGGPNNPPENPPGNSKEEKTDIGEKEKDTTKTDNGGGGGGGGGNNGGQGQGNGNTGSNNGTSSNTEGSGGGGSGGGGTGSGEGEITETIEEDFENLGTYASEDASEISGWLLESIEFLATAAETAAAAA